MIVTPEEKQRAWARLHAGEHVVMGDYLLDALSADPEHGTRLVSVPNHERCGFLDAWVVALMPGKRLRLEVRVNVGGGLERWEPVQPKDGMPYLYLSEAHALHDARRFYSATYYATPEMFRVVPYEEVTP